VRVLPGADGRAGKPSDDIAAFAALLVIVLAGVDAERLNAILIE
jgi:hypothetical protein